jgi:hypothetical protein
VGTTKHKRSLKKKLRFHCGKILLNFWSAALNICIEEINISKLSFLWLKPYSCLAALNSVAKISSLRFIQNHDKTLCIYSRFLQDQFNDTNKLLTKWFYILCDYIFVYVLLWCCFWEFLFVKSTGFV